MEYAKWFGETIYIEWKVITGDAGEITAFEVKLYLEDKIKVIDCRLSAAVPGGIPRRFQSDHAGELGPGDWRLRADAGEPFSIRRIP